MSGLNQLDRLRAAGVPLRKGNYGPMVAVEAIEFAPEGHALAHPRAHFPVDRALVESFKAKGALHTHPFLVFEGGRVKKKYRLWAIDCARRLKAARVAEAELRAEGKLPLPGDKSKDDRLYVYVSFFKGTEVAAKRARLRENADPDKLPDSPSVLYAMFSDLERSGVSEADIRADAPRGCDVAAILRWHQLHPDVQARIDADASLVPMIAALADTPQEDQPALFEQLLASGATTARKAKREAKKARGETVVRRASPAALAAFSGFKDEFVAVADFAAFLNGDPGPLRKSNEALLARLEAVWSEAAKSGRRVRKSEVKAGEPAVSEPEATEVEVEVEVEDDEVLAAAGGEAEA